jgi:MFS transporter, BCD family, chlorophyll transporter
MNPASRLQALNGRLSRTWTRLGPRFLPFADAATDELPLGRLLRLALFQVSVGMAAALLVGTLNRVMIVELGMAAWLVALMVALPVLLAPLRALVGFRSDFHVSALGWRRVPFLWFGSLLQFGGLSIMPFALILMSGTIAGDIEAHKAWIGPAAAALAFLLVGAGLQTTQTAGLALATDLAPEHSRPRVVALMYVMLLVGMVGSSLLFGWLLSDFSPTRLVQVVQGAAVVTVLLNGVALWKQEPRRQLAPAAHQPRPAFTTQWRAFAQTPGTRRFLVSVALGTAAFNMQDIILEPYGGEILHLGVGATTALTALMAGASLCAFGLAARWLQRGVDPHRLSAAGLLPGLLAFSAVIFAEPLQSATVFRVGVALIGFGGGLFAVGTLAAAMGLDADGRLGTGLVIGAWGAVHALSSGVAVALGGALRDLVSGLAVHGQLGSALVNPATGYSFVYHVELYLLFATLIAIGPLVRARGRSPTAAPAKFGLAEFPA